MAYNLVLQEEQMRRLFILALVILACSAGADGSNTVPGKKMQTPPVLDGTVSNEEWSSAATEKKKLFEKFVGRETDEVGQYWIAYDEKYIYIAARITLVNPVVKAEETREGVSFSGDDSFSLALDPFGKWQDINYFSFNANGATQWTIAGGRASKREWQGRIEAAGRVTETGWEGEARIPWEIMSLPKAGVHDMRFTTQWYVSSTQEGLTDHFLNRTEDLKILSGVEVPKMNTENPLLILPYGYAGVNSDGGHIVDVGLDMKSQVFGKNTAVATINPDFRNVEQDVLDLDFSDFERLASETRPFFLEGGEYFLTATAFSSQRIRDFDSGGKLYGSLDDRTRYGVLSTVDFENEHTFAGFTRLSANTNSSYSASLVTLDRAGENNVTGTIGSEQRSGDFYFYGDFASSHDESIGTGESFLVGAMHFTPGVSISSNYSAVSPTYLPRLGFAPITDVRRINASLQLDQRYSKGPLSSAALTVGAADADHFSGGHYIESVFGSMRVRTRSQYFINLSSTLTHFLDRHDSLFTLYTQWPASDPSRRWSLSHTWGDISGARYQNTSLSATYRPESRLRLSLSHQMVDHFSFRDQTVFGFNWEMDEFQTIAGRAIQSGDEWNWYASYRMSGNEGAEYYLIVGDPNATTFQKSLILKVVAPLSIGG